nr:replication-associated protein [Avon-Heathcote Estuary associated circular virus 10]AJP36394.1 replication-associated protein [Avon-Heathcote Estuary associated circular virus 10]
MPVTQPVTKATRAICFTEFKKLTNWDDVKSQLRYYAYAEETCPKTGKKHYQGFAYSWKPIRFSGWKKMFPTAHIEQMRGNFRENTAYCSKEGSLIEFGEKPNENGVQGTAIEYKRRIEEGQSTMEIAEDENLFGQYLHSYKALEKYEQHIRGKKIKLDETPPEVYIRWGAAGTGKTHGVFKRYGRDKVCIVPDNTGKWFDNCHNSDVMLFDDVEIDAVPPISQFLRLTDRYPMQVPVKGGFIWWKPKVIVFTSNLPWEQWWNTLNTEHKRAVQRRLTRVTRIYKDHEKVEYENANYELLSQTQGFFASPPQLQQEVQEEPVHSQEEGEQVHEESGSASEEHSAV